MLGTKPKILGLNLLDFFYKKNMLAQKWNLSMNNIGFSVWRTQWNIHSLMETKIKSLLQIKNKGGINIW